MSVQPLTACNMLLMYVRDILNNAEDISTNHVDPARDCPEC